MGASNVAAAYARWAGKVPPKSMQLLTFMANVSHDNDPRPWFGQGHEALAEHALGRPAPIDKSGLKAVQSGITPLLKAGAVSVDRRASVRRDGPSTARYRLHLGLADAPRISGDVNADVPRISGDVSPSGPVDNEFTYPEFRVSRPPENGGRDGSRPPNFGLTPPEFRGTEETGGETTTEERELQEEVAEVRRDGTLVAREPAESTQPQPVLVIVTQPPATPSHPADPARDGRSLWTPKVDPGLRATARGVAKVPTTAGPPVAEVPPARVASTAALDEPSHSGPTAILTAAVGDAPAPRACPDHPGMRSGTRPDGLPACPLCRRTTRPRRPLATTSGGVP